MKRKWIALAGLLLAARGGMGMQTDNRGIHAVPVPGRVVIDGMLDDWDLSGQVLICYDVERLKDVYSGRVAMMYDDSALYVSVHWKDPVPMGNTHDPHFQAGKGWAGDCLQLRIKTDRICHVTAWCFADRTEPFINIEYGKDLNEPFGGGGINLFRTEGWRLERGAEMAFRKDADGRGYVQEIKLPWELITDKVRYRPGESFRCGVELLWGEADWPVHRYADNLADGASSREFFWTAKDAWGPVFLERTGRLNLPTPPWERPVAEEKREGTVEIAYELPREARVTLAIEDDSGRRVRNLIAAEPRRAGRHVELWDGLDDSGEIVKPGTYRVKGLYHEGLHLKYAISFASPANPPWKTADGTGAFYGDHTAPEAVAAGTDMLALACPMGEAGEHLIGVDMSGRRRWGLANRVAFGGGRISLATDGRTLWIANGDSSGAELGGRFTIWRCELHTGRYSPWKRTDASGAPVLDLQITPNRGMENCRAIAWREGSLAVIVAAERRLLILDPETGDVLKDWREMPAGMAACTFDRQGRLLLAAGDTLYVVDGNTGKLSPLVKGLEDPRGLACDQAGNIYVAQRGTRHNVQVFTARGRPIREIGRRGGRPAVGRFDETGMRDPAQIAIDSQGRLWVTESTLRPKRTSVWMPDGRLAFDLVGTTGYAEGGLLNPFDRTRGFSEGVEYALDYAKQSFRPLFTLHSPIVGEGGGIGKETRVVRIAGREYLATTGRQRSCGWVWIFLKDPDGSWRAVAVFGKVGDGSRPDDPHHREYNAQFKTPFWEGLFGKSFVWIDANGNGQAEREELAVRDVKFGRYYWGQLIGEDLTVAIPCGEREVMIFRPEGFTPRGVPRYSFDSAQRLRLGIGLGGEGMLAVGRDGRLYLNQTPLTAVDRSGKVLWTYPNDYVSVHGSHRAPAASGGLLIGPSSFYGTAFVNDEIGEVFYLNGNLGQNFIFTEDGLWVQSLYNDCRGWFDVPAKAVPGMSCDSMTAGGESFGGSFCRADDGKFYTVGGGTAAVVMEITGLETLKRFHTKAVVTERDIAAAQDIKLRRAAAKLAPKVYRIRRTVGRPSLDGDLSGWDMGSDSIEIRTGQSRVAVVKAMFDDENLYLAYDVADSSPLANTGQDERLMFITGDCVDLMLRTDPAEKSSQPVAGDLRLLMTVREGLPLAVLYRPVVPGTPQDRRVAFSSPWRTVWMDKVEVVKFPLALKKKPGGYAVTAAVPLALLGVKKLDGLVLRGDFGVLGSDSAGRECTSRNYWSNKATNNTNDVPDEAALTPALWGELRFE